MSDLHAAAGILRWAVIGLAFWLSQSFIWGLL